MAAKKRGFFFNIFFSSCSSKKVCCISILRIAIQFQSPMSISRNLLKISGSHFGKPTPIVSELKTCLYLNISSCQYSESWDSFVVNVYNPLGRQVDRYIRLPVKRDKVYTVQDHAGLSFFFSFKTWLLQPFSCYTTGQQQV